MKNVMKLVKYDLLKTKSVLIFSFLGVVILEVAFVIGQLLDISFLSVSTGALLFIGIFASFIAVLIYSISIFNMDISKKQGYLPFLTPSSAYKIVGAKLITTLIITFALILLIIIYGSIDTYLIARDSEPGVSIGYLFKVIGDELDGSWGSVGIIALSYISAWFNNIVCIYLAMALSTTLLGEKKIRGLIRGLVAFGLWAGINILMSIISFLLTLIFKSDMFSADINNSAMSLAEIIDLSFNNSLIFATIFLNVVLGVIMYMITGWLAEKKLSL